MMHRGVKHQKSSADRLSSPLLPASDCFFSEKSFTFPAAATASVKADSKFSVKTKLTYGNTEVEPGNVLTAIPSFKNVDVCLSAECITKKKSSIRIFSTGPDVICESLPLASLQQRESSRILQEKCQMYASRIAQLENELIKSTKLHRIMESELKAERDQVRSERDSTVIGLAKRILDSFEISVRSNDSWSDVGCEENSADCPTLSPAGDHRADRQNLRLNLFKNSCMCLSGDSNAISVPRIHEKDENSCESFNDVKGTEPCENNVSEERESGSITHDFEAALKHLKGDFTNKSACSFCTMYSECVHRYLENDDHDRNLLLHQLLAELSSALQDKSEYSDKLNSENTALELRVTHLESALLQQRNSITSRNIHGELFEECSRLRWRVLELEKSTKLSSEKILLEAPLIDEKDGSVEISVDPASPFSVIPSTRKRGYKIRKSINGLQSSTSPTPASSSSFTTSSPSFTTSSSTFTTSSSTFTTSSPSFTTSSSPSATHSSVQGVWSYDCEGNADDRATPSTEPSAPSHSHNNTHDNSHSHSHSHTHSNSNSHSHSNSECAASEDSAKREIEAIMKIQSELQGKLSSLVLCQERNSQKNDDQRIEHQIRMSKQKLKDEIREKINLKEKIAVQIEFEEKEKEQKENEISNCVQIEYLMGKVSQLMHLHDAKEDGLRALIRDLEGQVHTLSYQLHFAQGSSSTQERQSDSEPYDPSEGFEGECCGGDQCQYQCQYQYQHQDPYPHPHPHSQPCHSGISVDRRDNNSNSNSSNTSNSSINNNSSSNSSSSGTSNSSSSSCCSNSNSNSNNTSSISSSGTSNSSSSTGSGRAGGPCLVSTDSRDGTDFTDFDQCMSSSVRIKDGPRPCSFNTLLCSTSFSSTTTSPAASSVTSSPCKTPYECVGTGIKHHFSSLQSEYLRGQKQ